MSWGCVYLIYDMDNSDFLYVGSTRNFKDRLSRHKCNLMKDYKGNWNMKILEGFLEIHKDILRFIEEEYRLNLNPKFNKRKAYIDKKEYDKRYKEDKEYDKKYYKLNKDEILNKKKIYREEYREEHREYYKVYREENKEKLKEYNKKYYEENKDKILRKVYCECGLITSKSHISRHRKRQIHIQRMKLIESQDLILFEFSEN